MGMTVQLSRGRACFVLAFLLIGATVGVGDIAGANDRPLRLLTVEAVDVDSSGATISWATNRRARGVVRYGTTRSYGLEVEADGRQKNLSVRLADLEPDTVYFYEVRVKRSGDRTRRRGWFRTTPELTNPFACLSAGVDIDLSGREFTGRQFFRALGDDLAVDLRGTDVAVHDQSEDAVVDGEPVVDSRWGLLQLKDPSTDLCVAGGSVVSSNPVGITWAENYDTEGIGRGYRLGTTRNHTAIDAADATRPVVSGLHFFNLHDGPRFNQATDWTLQHSWGEYTRDDCVENDSMASGVIQDSLFDGCYTGYSNRPTDSSLSGIGRTVTFDQVLLRMEMMPGPYKACERSDQYYDRNRDPYRTSPCVERDVFGTGYLFKLADQSDPTGGVNPTFNLIDSVFVVEQVPDGDRRADFPPAAKIDQCRDVTVIYLGDAASEADYPGRLPPTGCHTFLTGAEGRQAWRAHVADWHARHPGVAADRKDPATYGDLTFPRQPRLRPGVAAS
jgi:hypothetical protein